MLNKYELSVAKEEADKVDTLRYTWEKLLSRSTEVQNELVSLQPNFRGELLSNVETFVEDCKHFYQDYDKVKDKEHSECMCAQTLKKAQTTFTNNSCIIPSPQNTLYIWADTISKVCSSTEYN